MLTDIQKKQIKKCLSWGFTDPHIARAVGDITAMHVYMYRHGLGITRKDVLENRYDRWAKLLTKGVPANEIADFYGVKELSLKVALWRTKGFSLVDAKKKAARKNKAQHLLLKDGIPSFKKPVG